MKRYAALSILFSACALPAGDVDSVTSPIIYGTDDRLEVFEAPRADANLARQSVAVMIDSRDIDRRLGLIDGVPLRTRRNRRYCDDQPFLDQPQVGSCSGTLIDGDLFVTAGHCMGLSTRTTLDGSAVPVADVRAALARKCDTTAVIFNHVNEAGGWTAPDRDRDIFYCHEVLVHSFVPTPAEGPSQARFDVTVFSLKRSRTGTRAEPVFQPYAAAPIPSSPRTISPIATSPAGTTLLGIGGPEGLPLKIKRSPLLTTEGDLWVRTLLDVNGGDSGGGVFLQIGGTWTHIGVASHFTHPRFYCPGDEQEEGGSYCARNDGAPDECRTEAFHSGESNLYNTGHSMTHRAYDVLCGGAPAQGMIGPASRYSGFICGTGPRVSPVPFVPRTPDTEPDPPTNTDGGGGGCSTSDAGSSGALLVLLVLGLRRRRLRHGVATSMLALMLACSGDSDPTGEPPTTEPPTTEPPTTETPRHPTDPDESLSHAVSQLQLPSTRDEFGWDLDGDGSVDAAMGELVELTSSLGITLDDYLR
ncbi:MAG: MYXO-CTERM sorting domain-containing protein, partial [Myxococcota bacterium]